MMKFNRNRLGGIVFASSENRPPSARRQRLKRLLFSRYAWMGLVVILSFSLMLGRTAYMQLIASADTRSLLDAGTTRQMRLAAPRGDIVDDSGMPVAYSINVKNLYMAYAGLESEQFNHVLLELSRLLDRYQISYAKEVEDYFNLDDMTFAKTREEMIEWQKDEHFLGLKDLPKGQKESSKDTQFVKTSPRVFYDYMRSTRFMIPDTYTEAEQKKVFALRFVIYLQNWFFQQGSPVLIASDIPNEVANIVTEQNYRYIGAISSTVSQRQYSETAQYMAQVLGYVGDINQEEYNQLKNQGYGYRDVIGKTGIELVAERYLHGTNGIAPYSIWSADGGRADETSTDGGKPSLPGYDVALTIQPELQKATMDALRLYVEGLNSTRDDPKLGKSAGCAVMLDLKRNAAVIAMANYPSFDPRDFVNMASDDEAADRVEDYLTDTESKPMLNRAISQLYAPGSTFKPFTGVSALENGAVDAGTVFRCEHILYVDGHMFRCDGTHYDTSIEKALAYSCNIFFYQAGMATGIDQLSETYKALGLGEPTGIELYGEAIGVRPSRAVKASLYDMPGDQEWFPADTAQVSIGQGLNSYTVLQLARATAGIATGKLYSPYLIRQVTDQTGAIVFKAEPKVTDLPFSEQNLQTIRNGMREVITDPLSTVHNEFLSAPVSAAGKTGTAETVYAESQMTTNGLFICFAPFDDPEVAICVAAETGAAGSGVSNVAVAMLEAYYGGASPSETTASPGVQ